MREWRRFRVVFLPVLSLLTGVPGIAHAGGGALEPLLIAFANRVGEKQLASVPNITWQGAHYPNEHDKDLALEFYLLGQLRLEGFGEVDLPQGVGASATMRRGNEGESNFQILVRTKPGPLGGPLRIDLKKPYPSKDYAAILQRQITRGKVVLLADDCKTDDLGRAVPEAFTAFLRMDLPGTQTPVFVRASRDEQGSKNSPGATSFSFSLFTPGSEMAKRSCAVRPTPPL